MKLFKNAKRTLSLLLTAVMALTMMSVMSVSAEDTTTETETETETSTVSVYDRFTWSPLRGVTATKTGIAYEYPEDYTVDITDDTPVGTTVTTSAIETNENEDGTLTSSAVRIQKTYTDNGDGTATVSTKKTIFQTSVFTNPNPASKNTNFKFGIYSNRECCTGVMYCTNFNPYANQDGNTAVTATNLWNNRQHSLTVNDDKSSVSEHPEHDVKVSHIEGYNSVKDTYAPSYYLTQSQEADLENTLMFVLRQYNHMNLEFVAPEDGVYTASGTIGEGQYGGTGTSGESTTYYFLKVDENGVEHALTDSRYVPNNDSAEALSDVKVALKAGEKLVLRAGTDIGYVGKLFLKDYLVTKWDYSEADDTELTDKADNSTVTVNYGYQNQTFYNVYGEGYTLGDSNFETLWDVKAAKYQNDVDELDKTTPTADFNIVKDYGVYTNVSDFNRPATGGSYNPGIWYDSATGAVTGSLYYNGTYRNGLQFKFTVPEDGYVVLTGATSTGDNAIARVGIKKKGEDNIVYGLYYVKSGTAYNDKVTSERGNWSQLRYVTGTNYRVHTIGELEAGDEIYYEMCLMTDTASGDALGKKSHDLSTLSVAITTENSVADINGDFKGDATDTVYMRKFLLRTFEAADKSVFDLTGDGSADIRDLVKIKKLIAGIYE